MRALVYFALTLAVFFSGYNLGRVEKKSFHRVTAVLEVEVSNLVRNPEMLNGMSDARIREIVCDSPEWFFEDARWTIRREK